MCIICQEEADEEKLLVNMTLTSACVYVYSSAYLSLVLPFDDLLWPLLFRSLARFLCPSPHTCLPPHTRLCARPLFCATAIPGLEDSKDSAGDKKTIEEAD